VTGLGEAAAEAVRAAVARTGRIVVLTGAGISAESGIPTFRGPEGYWTVGSEVHRPEELATGAFFRRAPDDVWAWYLHRLRVCRTAEPNAAHLALARLEQVLGDRVRLITQNVDGLHLRAGSTPERTYQVHGNIGFLRCAAECSPALIPIVAHDDAAALPAGALDCPACGGRGRPHVLWFDEAYDEARYRFSSALDAAAAAVLLVTVGTSAATTLPNLAVRAAVDAGAALVDVNPEPNPFRTVAEQLGAVVPPRGAAVPMSAGVVVPTLVDLIVLAAAG
jgi:NAD-dependent deacetylase